MRCRMLPHYTPSNEVPVVVITPPILLFTAVRVKLCLILGRRKEGDILENTRLLRLRHQSGDCVDKGSGYLIVREVLPVVARRNDTCPRKLMNEGPEGGVFLSVLVSGSIDDVHPDQLELERAVPAADGIGVDCQCC